MRGKTKNFFIFLLVIMPLIFTSCEKTKEIKTAYSKITISLPSVNFDRKVRIRLYSSDYQLQAISADSEKIIANQTNSSFILKQPDSDGRPTIYNAQVPYENNFFFIHAAIDDNGDGSYNGAEKVCVKVFSQNTISAGYLSFSLVESDFSPSVFRTIQIQSIQDGYTPSGTLYCLWFLNRVSLSWGAFSNTQVLSTTYGTVNNGVGSASSLYGNWFGAYPSQIYHIYCFIDTNNNQIPDYNIDFHSRIYHISPSGSTYSAVFSKIVE